MSSSAASVPTAPLSSESAARLRDRARASLVRSLAEEQGYVRVHAAEGLAVIGDGAQAREAYLRDLPALEAGAARVGAWRVLAITARTAAERMEFVEKIGRAFLVPGATDRLQALESLCKLHAPIVGPVFDEAVRMSVGPEGERPLAFWALHLGGEETALARLVALLGSATPLVRLRAAYALRWTGLTDAAGLTTLAAVTDVEPADSVAYPYLLSAALAVSASPERAAAWLERAIVVLRTGNAGARYELGQTLAAHAQLWPALDVEALERSAGDERIGAALLAWTLASGR